MQRSAALRPIPAQPFQFTIRSLFWLMITLGMVLAFVRPADGRYLPIALITGLVGIGWAALVGWKSSRIVESVYWGLLAMSLAVICLAGQTGVARPQMIGWPAVGVAVGAIAGAGRPGTLHFKLPACVLVGTTLISTFIGIYGTLATDWVDIALAAVVAAMVAIFSEVFAWARNRYHTSYGAWAASLVLAVILGNWGAVWITQHLGG